MQVRLTLASVAAAALWITALPEARAIGSGEIRDVAVVGHHFATSVASRTRRVSAKDPDRSRMVVIKLKMTVPDNGTKLFTSDFALAYQRGDGKEARSGANAICAANTAEVGEERGCAVGTGSTWTRLSSGRRYVALSFFVQSDVREVTIYRLGAPDPVAYRIGIERPVSVFITTNDDSERMAKIEQAVTAGAYQVVRTSERLTSKHKGVLIHYASGAETHAREISQRIMQVTGDVPTLKPMRLATTKDVVIWLGH